MEIFPWKIGATPRRRAGLPRRRGPPRHGHARLGEPGDNREALSGSPKCAHDCLRPMFVACFRSVRGLICDCLWLASGTIV